MSAAEAEAITTAGEVIACGATAEFCVCAKPAGHVVAGDPTHGCDPGECTAQWQGDFGSDDWRPVTMPSPVSL